MSIGIRARIAGMTIPDARGERRAFLVRGGIILLLVAGLLGLSALAISSAGIANADSSVPTAAGPLGKVRSLMAMLADRSPGSRTTAELTKTKRKRAEALPQSAPHERALGKIRRPLVPAEFLKALAPNIEVADTTPLIDLNPLGVPAPQFALAEAPPGGVTGGSPVVPVGGGGGGGSSSSPPTGSTPTPPSAVPEPGTWAMMLFGFLMLGTQLKRARRQRQPALPAAA